MNLVLGFGIIILFMVLFVRPVIGTRKRQLGASYNQDKAYTNYFISLKNVERPNLIANEDFNQVAKIKFETSDGYSVASSVNDITLRQLIMDAYDLKPSQVIVTYRQVVV